MIFENLKPFHRKYKNQKIIELESNGVLYDLHNACQFLDISYNLQKASLVFKWHYYDYDYLHRRAFIELHCENVTDFSISEKNRNLPLEESETLEEIEAALKNLMTKGTSLSNPSPYFEARQFVWTVEFTYDANGNLTQELIDRTRHKTYAYNQDDRMTHSAVYDFLHWQGIHARYEYDGLGRRAVTHSKDGILPQQTTRSFYNGLSLNKLSEWEFLSAR